MATFVVDVNVVVKWRVPEVLSAQASLFLDRDDIQLLAPGFLLIEANNVFATKVRQGEVDAEIASDFLESLYTMLQLAPVEPMLPSAFLLSTAHGVSVYDALYVALALREECAFITADEKLLTKLRPMYPETMVWLGDVTSTFLEAQ